MLRVTLGEGGSFMFKRSTNIGDRLFKGIAFFFGFILIALIALIISELFNSSTASFQEFGFGFLTGQVWSAGEDIFGALPFIMGTILSSIIALFIATPLAVGIAIYLVEMAPDWISKPVGFLVELLAAIPSIIYGMWGIFVLGPFLIKYVAPPITETLGETIPLFAGPFYGVGLVTAGIVLAIMILPTIASISRDVLHTVPYTQREGAYGIGATKWEMIRIAVLTYARSGILGAMIIGLGRAIGETMAVALVIGNNNSVPESIFQPAATMASVIANEFGEASTGLLRSALFEIGLVLFVVTFLVNLLARVLVWSISRGTQEVK